MMGEEDRMEIKTLIMMLLWLGVLATPLFNYASGYANDSSRPMSSIGATNDTTSYKKRSNQQYYLPPVQQPYYYPNNKAPTYPSYDPGADNPGGYIILINPQQQQQPSQRPRDGFDRPLFDQQPYDPYQ